MTNASLDDIEAPLSRLPAGSKLELRFWLRMLACVNFMSAEIRRRLRAEFDVTLPQFDVLAQLQREPDGLRSSELSRRLMVTKGNLTGLVDTLVEAGFVKREAVPIDRRAQTIRLTRRGATRFAQMADAHERWLIEFFADLDRSTLSSLIAELDHVKQSARRNAVRSDRV
jgi:DNA-binding MarR family transcriptional regulator